MLCLLYEKHLTRSKNESIVSTDLIHDKIIDGFTLLGQVTVNDITLTPIMVELRTLEKGVDTTYEIRFIGIASLTAASAVSISSSPQDLKVGPYFSTWESSQGMSSSTTKR